jgi:cell division protein FtsQ
VSVSRELYPPQVTIAIRERQPVASTVANPTTLPPQEKGYLDAKGVWMPADSYQSSEALTLPELTVIGYQPQYQFQWAQIYAQLQASPVTVSTVNWQDPANLILETELGEVHLGGNLENFPQQLQTLAKLRNLLQQEATDKMDYINLKDPDFILIELVSE